MKTFTEFDMPNTNKYPHVIENLRNLWGDVEFINYITKLIIVEEVRVHRSGFPLSVVVELQHLKNYYVDNLLSIVPDDQVNYAKAQYVNRQDVWV